MHNQKSNLKEKEQIAALFPLPPYDIQKSLALSLYQNLNNIKTKIMIVESPTGTGKTYSLLVGTCKWLHQNAQMHSKNHMGQLFQSKIPSWLRKSSVKAQEKLMQKERKEKQLIDIEDIANQLKKEKQKFYQLKRGEKDKNEKGKQQHLEKDIFDQISDSQDQQKAKKKKRTLISSRGMQIIQMEEEDPPFKIIFLSRTHSQLQQVIQSFKKISHNFEIKSLILGAKNHLCINPTVNPNREQGSSNVYEKCQYLMDHGGCPKYHKLKVRNFFELTIQESFDLGKSHGLCSYYSLRNLTPYVGLLCIPYISILEPQIRKNLGINIKNSIVIFDEAHNVFDYELSLLSPEINYIEISSLTARIEQYLQKYGNKMSEKSLNIVNHLTNICKSFLNILKQQLIKFTKFSQQKKSHYYRKLKTVQLIVQMGILQIKAHQIVKYFQISNFDKKLINFKPQEPFSPNLLKKIIKFITLLCITETESVILLKSNQEDGKKRQQLNSFSLKFLTLQSNAIQQIIRESKMTIFAGGTMHPLDQFYSIKQKFKTKELIYSHMIPRQQCLVFCVNSFQNQRIIFNYMNFKDKLERQINIIKVTLLKIMQKLKKEFENQPAGLVFFLQNYNFVEVLKENMNQKGLPPIIFDLKKLKNNPLKLYQDTLKKQNRAILCSVVGGSLSQGINFSDQLARAIVLFGLPYPNIKAPQIIERMNFYDKKFEGNFTSDILDVDPSDLKENSQTGKSFYENLCMKAINQTIGRGIRHSKDRANIYLVDYRFQKNKNELSSWLRDRVIVKENLQDL